MFSILSLEVLPFLYWQMFCMIIINFKKLKKMKKEEEKQGLSGRTASFVIKMKKGEKEEGKQELSGKNAFFVILPFIWVVVGLFLILLGDVSLMRGMFVLLSGIWYVLFSQAWASLPHGADMPFLAELLFVQMPLMLISIVLSAITVSGLFSL